MKLFNKILIIISVVVFVGCDYLDVVPDNIATIDYAFRNRAQAEKYLFTCYSYRPEIGSPDVDPGLMGGDETWQFYPTTTVYTTWNTSLIARGNQNVSDPYINFWDGENGGSALWTGIRDCNIFLENIKSVPDMTDAEIAQWTAEVKALKAYYHYFLFKCYGPIPIVDKNLDISATTDAVQVYREPVDSVVNYVVNLMDEAYDDLPAESDLVPAEEAGRITKLIDKSMKAEVLLFAASPLFNGNTDYSSIVDNKGRQLFSQEESKEKWKTAADACFEAIVECEAAGKQLYDEIDANAVGQPENFQLEAQFRGAVTDKWNDELIWGNTNNDYSLLSKASQARLMSLSNIHACNSKMAPTLKIVESFYSSNGVPIDEDKEWNANGWYDLRRTLRDEVSSGDEVYYVKEGKQTAYLHYNREPRFYASVGFDQGIYWGSGYYDFDNNVKYANFLYLGYSGYQGGAEYSVTGYSAKKMHSYNCGLTSSSFTVEYYPFPIMRLANLYLMYAEALNEYYGTSAQDEILFYLDQIRKRAGLDGVVESWTNYSNNPTKYDTQDGMREIIHQERTIELAFEGKRFWDIRRWKKITELNDQPMGWTIKAEEAKDFYNAVSCAQTPVSFSVKDYFWPIKEEDLTVNENLVQNYGW